MYTSSPFGSNRYLSLALALMLFITCKPTVKSSHNESNNKQDTLYTGIMMQDSIMFAAFNSGNLELFSSFLDSSLEVFQDNKGLRNYTASLEAFQSFVKPGMQVQRHLVPASMEVYPIKDYGAIQTGSHTFCHPENGKETCGTFKFVHIWKFSNNRWRITRIVTYDHPM